MTVALALLFWWLVTSSAQKQTVFPDTQVVFPLSGDQGPNWTLSSTDGVYIEIPAKIPGDVLCDLMRAGKMDDPYYERNFLTQRQVWMGSLAYHNNSKLERRTRTWVYSTEFELDPLDNQDTHVLILEGVKMGASVAVNGVVLGNVTDQFLRFQFVLNEDVLGRGSGEPSELRRRELSSTRTTHQLVITFDPTIATSDGRFSACSGGWDWSLYSRAGDERGSRVFSFGIFQPIYVVKQHFASITHVVPKIYYLGPYARYGNLLLLPTGLYSSHET